MNLQSFIDQSGFKILSMMRLGQCEYSIVLYLINCLASGLVAIVSTESELALLTGYKEDEVEQALKNLLDRKIISCQMARNANQEGGSMRLGFVVDTSTWTINFGEDVTSQDAVVYPFVRHGDCALEIVTESEDKDRTPAQQIWDEFSQGRIVTEQELSNELASAETLMQTHPLEQILLMVRHFREKIPTLSLLASSWEHFHEQLVIDTQKVDLIEAKQKHNFVNDEVRNSARQWLKKAEELKLSPEEQNVLWILIRHRHPRRQLFWASRLEPKYPRLKDFFSENSHRMLKITSTGRV